MTSKTLGNLTDATALTGTEQVYVVQSSNSRKSTAQDIADLGTSQDNMTDGTTNKNYTATEQTKLAGIATGATANTGTVTSAALSVPTGLSVSGSPITTSGTFAITYASGYEGFTTALKTLVNSAVQPADVREVLTADRTYYVATTGSDNNDGLTSGTAFATIAKAVTVAYTVDTSIYNITINVADGSYTGGAISANAAVVGKGNIYVVGNETTPANVVYTSSGDCFAASNFGTIYVRGMKLVPATNRNALYANGIGQIFFQNIEFGGGSNNSHLVTAGAGLVQATGNYTISGGAVRHINADRGGQITVSGFTVTLTGTPAFTQFVLASNASRVLLTSSTFSGSATGTRYYAQTNAVIMTNGGGASFLPGDVNGSVATGGQYA